MMKIFSIAGSYMSAQSQRLNVVASNLANADSAVSANGQPYRAKQVVFQTTPLSDKQPNVAGVRVSRVIEDQAPPRLLYDPKSPLADANGYVTMPNVNPVEEMVNMISASRSYQTNADMMNAAKTMMLKTLQLGQS